MSKREASAMRIAIVGAGYVSRHHVGALKKLDHVEIVGIADARIDAARALAHVAGIPIACTGLDELLAARLDCVFILTPPSSHAQLSIKALRAGCHVFVEKPMAETADECRAMIEAARQAGRVLSVNHSDLFDPAVMQALEHVRAGVCGELLSVDIIRSSEYPPYAGGPLPGMVSKGSYPFQDLGVHALYQIEAFLGRIEQLDVTFQGTGRHPNLRYDEWLATARCERGIGRVRLSWNARPMSNRLLVQGTRGRIEVDKFLQTCVATRLLPGPKFIGMVVSGIVDPLKAAVQVSRSVLRFATGRLKSSPGIVAGSTAFVKSLREGAEPPVRVEDAARIVALLEPASREADAAWSDEQAARRIPLAPVANLVTGAGGFVGRALVQRLLGRGETVRVLVRRPHPEWVGRQGLQVVIGDLGDPAAVSHAVQGVERIFHVGAAMKGWREDFESGTIWGTRNILAACRDHGVRRLVHVSSMSVLDHAGNDPSVPLTEQSALEPYPQRRGLYTQTKLQAEEMVRTAIAERSVDAVIVRPGQIFGSGSEKAAPNGVIAIAGRWIVVGNGGASLPLVHLDDVVDGLLSAGESDAAVGQTIHLVNTAEVTQRQYIDALGDAAPKVAYVPAWGVMLLATGIEWLGRLLRREVPLTRYRVQSLRPLSNFDLTRAMRLLQWTPKNAFGYAVQQTVVTRPAE